MGEIYLVRHGQASFGTDDYDRLSPLGHSQSRWLGEHLREAGLHFDGVACGRLVRHRETLAGIQAGLGQVSSALILPGLDEFDFQALVDAWWALHPEQRPQSPNPADRKPYYRALKQAMQAWADGALAQALPETWAEFAERVAGAWSRLQQQEGRWLVVSSGGVIAMTVHQILQTPARQVVDLNLQIRNTSVTQCFFNEHALRLSAFNQVAHLERDGRRDSITYS